MYCIVYIAVDVKDIDEASDTIGAFFEAKINRITQVRLKTTGVYILYFDPTLDFEWEGEKI